MEKVMENHGNNFFEFEWEPWSLEALILSRLDYVNGALLGLPTLYAGFSWYWRRLHEWFFSYVIPTTLLMRLPVYTGHVSWLRIQYKKAVISYVVPHGTALVSVVSTLSVLLIWST